MTKLRRFMLHLGEFIAYTVVFLAFVFSLYMLNEKHKRWNNEPQVKQGGGGPDQAVCEEGSRLMKEDIKNAKN